MGLTIIQIYVGSHKCLLITLYLHYSKGLRQMSLEFIFVSEFEMWRHVSFPLFLCPCSAMLKNKQLPSIYFLKCTLDRLHYYISDIQVLAVTVGIATNPGSYSKYTMFHNMLLTFIHLYILGKACSLQPQASIISFFHYKKKKKKKMKPYAIASLIYSTTSLPIGLARIKHHRTTIANPAR